MPESLLEGAPAVEETVEDMVMPAEDEDVPMLPAEDESGNAESDVPLLDPETPQDDTQPDE